MHRLNPTHARTHALTSWLPWEKFKRATFIPDLIISFSISTEREAGPSQATEKKVLGLGKALIH